jgi:putative ABC transport system substrate-binding protein
MRERNLLLLQYNERLCRGATLRLAACKCLVLPALLLCGGFSLCWSPKIYAARNIVVVYSDSSKHTLRTLSGLEWSLQDCQPKCEVSKFYLLDTDISARTKVDALKPDLLITVGSAATSFADKSFPNLPVVFAKVLNPMESGFIQSWEKSGRHVTGAALDIPAELQMKRLMSIMPDLKKVGVIYTEKTARLTEEARKAAASLGIQLVAYELSSAKELPDAIDSLCKSVDAIWTVADEELSTPQFIRFTLLETLRHRIPIMGFNQTFVESGALLCLEADYKYNGRQAAEIAISILNGTDPSKVKPMVPDIVYLYLNLKTGKLLNLNLPPELVAVAKETY